jgi:hypothetical protein
MNSKRVRPSSSRLESAHLIAIAYIWPSMSIPVSTDAFNPDFLRNIVSFKMPFGKYEGRLLCDLPIHYLEWFKRQGFPKGKLGMLLETVYEIKLNGLDDLLFQLKKMQS